MEWVWVSDRLPEKRVIKRVLVHLNDMDFHLNAYLDGDTWRGAEDHLPMHVVHAWKDMESEED